MSALCLTETRAEAVHQLNAIDNTKETGTPKTPSRSNNASTPTSACIEAIYLLDQALYEAYKTVRLYFYYYYKFI